MKNPFSQPLLSVDELSSQLSNTHVVVLDCRYSLADFTKGRKDYLENHIPGAYFMDIGKDFSSPVIPGVTGRHPLPHPEVLTFTLRAAGINHNSFVVLYDQANGAYASRGWWLLHWLGHDQVAVLDGGFAAWKSKGFPLDNQWPAPKKGDFMAKINTNLTISRFEVEQLNANLVDSREFKRYTGESEPIDPVAGHVKGAVCIPYADNTDENGFWKSPEDLQKRFAILSSLDSSPPVFYCGSGVTACHNILAYKIATGRDARLYPGSWSEWIHYYPPVTGATP